MTRPIIPFLVSLVLIAFESNAQINRPIGTNLAGVEDWSEEFVFVNVMHQSREWIAHEITSGSPWSSDVEIPLRPDGYPIEIPYDNGIDPPQGIRTLFFFGDLANIYPGGNYRLKAQGSGTIEFWGAASGTFQCPVDTTILVDATFGGFAMEILTSQIGDPVHNVEIIMPGYENVYETNPFYPPLLNFIEDFQCIRFMDWMKTNGSNVVEWSDRNLKSNYTQTLSNGIAYEYMIDLCNLMQKDIWINIPHQADNNFITEFARLLRDNLDGNLKIYLEYSNEVWNGIFPQNQYAAEQGLLLGYSGPEWERAWKFTAKRSADVFHIFENEFIDHSRLEKVIPGFAASSWITNYIIERFNETTYNPNQVDADAVAIAPYFAGGVADNIAELGLSATITVQEILDSMEYSLPEAYGFMSDCKTVADAHGLEMIAYEGGQHLVTYWPHNQDSLYVSKLLDANRDPRMETMYCEYFDEWYNVNNGGLFANFSSHGHYSIHGSWGVKEDYEDFNGPKYLGLQNCVFNTNTTTSIEDVIVEQPCIELFPNPVVDQFTIKGNLSEYDILVVDINGNTIANYSSIGSIVTIKLDDLPSGMYLVSIINKSNAEIYMEKIIKM